MGTKVEFHNFHIHGARVIEFRAIFFVVNSIKINNQIIFLRKLEYIV
jgi:hypothetical protein